MIMDLRLVLVESEAADDILWVEEKCTHRLSRIAREFGLLGEGERWRRLSLWGCEVESWEDRRKVEEMMVLNNVKEDGEVGASAF
jgi:hypothetical protein